MSLLTFPSMHGERVPLWDARDPPCPLGALTSPAARPLELQHQGPPSTAGSAHDDAPGVTGAEEMWMRAHMTVGAT